MITPYRSAIDAGAPLQIGERAGHARVRRKVLSEGDSGHWTELHVHWRRRIDERAQLELAADRIYPEHGNIVGILVSGVKKASRRV